MGWQDLFINYDRVSLNEKMLRFLKKSCCHFFCDLFEVWNNVFIAKGILYKVC